MDCTVNGPLPSTNSISSDNKSDNNNSSSFGEFKVTVDQRTEALFVPSFFWHEVLSAPGPPHTFQNTFQNTFSDNIRGGSNSNSNNESTRSVQLNVALNYWFAPLYAKEFPCARCRKQLNPKYRQILESLFAQGLIT